MTLRPVTRTTVPIWPCCGLYPAAIRTRSPGPTSGRARRGFTVGRSGRLKRGMGRRDDSRGPARSREPSHALCIVCLAMVEGHTHGRASWRSLFAAALGVAACAALPASAGAASAAAGPAIAPGKIAIVVLENKDYDGTFGLTGSRFVVGNPEAPYLNGTIIPESLSLVPTPAGCDHPAGDVAGVALKACRSGMFQSYRNELGFRIRASAPEYAW